MMPTLNSRRLAFTPRLLLASLCVIAAACSGSDATAANHQASTTATPAVTAAAASGATAQKEKVMTASKSCKDDNLHRSACMIDLILADLAAHYDAIDGGGISQIKAESSTSYSVSLPQEERIDKLTYEFELGAGKVTLKSKTESTESVGG